MRATLFFSLIVILVAQVSAQQGIQGQVLVDSTGVPVERVEVTAFEFPDNPDTQAIGFGVLSDANGFYSIDSLSPGTHYLFVRLARVSDVSLIGEFYDDIQCDGACRSGDFGQYQDRVTFVEVNEGEFTHGIDFRLSLGASVSGTLRDELTGEPITGPSAVGIRIQRVTTAPFSIDELANTFSESDGSFRFGEGFTPGNYTLFFSGSRGSNNYFSELFDDQVCFRSCQTAPSSCGSFCDYGLRSEVTIASPSTEVRLEVDLLPAGGISGSVSDNVTGAPFAGRDVASTVDLFQDDGVKIASERIGNDGAYFIKELPAGIYFARAESPYSTQLFDTQDCDGDCDVTAGTPIMIELGSQISQVNFTLTGDTVFRGGFESQ